MELKKIEKDELNNYAIDFWHRSEWIDYCVNSRFDKGIDCTVAAYDGTKIMAIIPLIKEGEEFTFQGSFGPQILLIEDTKLPKQLEIINMIKKHAYLMDVKRIAISGIVPSFLNNINHKCVLDLDYLSIRKSYKTLLKNKNLNHYIAKTCDVDRLKDLYNEIAGKITRPPATWEAYKSWIDKGYASIVVALKDGVEIGFILVTHYKREAYYFLSGVLPDYKKYNVSHYLQGSVFDLLATKEITEYNLGNIDSNSLLSCPTEKEKNISFFKSGFGDIYYNMVSEYFLCRKYFKKVYTERINNYIGAEYNEKQTDGDLE